MIDNDLQDSLDASGYREKKDNLDVQEDNKRRYNTIKAQWELFPDRTISEQRKKMYERYRNGGLQNE